MGHRTRLSRRIAIAAGTLGLAACSGPGGASEQVRELQADPMAAPDLLGMTLLSSSVTEPTTTLGKPVYASVSNEFQVTPDEGPALLQRALDLALSHGWAGPPSYDTTFLAWSGTRDEPPCTLSLTLLEGRLLVQLTSRER
ncbi:MAG: hypothetical protein Q3997_09010 [Propionibacteriaceae bacterium]|nr:hypothetical protein [Propionibacteriaceae bacterium]